MLCRLDDIPKNGAKGIEVGEGDNAFDLILLRRGNRILGYRNACPHQGTPLETFPDKFLDDSGEFLICSTHGARFRADNGFCVGGPAKAPASSL
jgi:nitrite reductase/ring-hydroxylating ferredoxin subunit